MVDTAYSKKPSHEVEQKLGSARRLAVRLAKPRVSIPALVVVAIIFVAALAPILTSADPNQIVGGDKNLLPGHVTSIKSDTDEVTHLLGTDNLGRDMLSRVLFGARVSLLVGVGVSGGAVLLGLFVGLVSGFFRRVDPFVMRLLDGIMAIPTILMAIAAVTVFGSGLFTIIFAAAIAEIPGIARLVRSVVLRTREEPFVEAARSIGTSPSRILWRHILPSTLPPMAILATYTAAVGILVESSLSFLGLGVGTSIPTWGNMIADGRLLYRLYPHEVLVPAASLAVLTLSVNLLGDGLRDEFDPRLAVRT